MASSVKFQAVVERHADKRQALIIKLLKLILGLWGSPKHRYDNWDLALATIAQTLVVLDQGLHETRTLTRSYSTQLLKDLDANPRDLPAIKDIYPRSGVTALEVYKRPIEQYLHEIKEGATEEAAKAAAEERLTALVEQDVMLTERDEAGRVYQAAGTKVTGFRRILHPELAKDHHSCGLCIAAATRVYYVDELLPLHGGCHCGTAPITGDSDPGLKLNQDDLEKLYDAAGSTSAGDLLNIRANVTEHGELGPILVRDGEHFRDVTEVNRDSSRKQYTPWSEKTLEQQRQSWEAIRASSQRAIERLKAAEAGGDVDVALRDGGQRIPAADIPTALKYHQALIDRYTAQLGG